MKPAFYSNVIAKEGTFVETEVTESASVSAEQSTIPVFTTSNNQVITLPPLADVVLGKGITILAKTGTKNFKVEPYAGDTLDGSINQKTVKSKEVFSVISVSDDWFLL